MDDLCSVENRRPLFCCIGFFNFVLTRLGTSFVGGSSVAMNMGTVEDFDSLDRSLSGRSPWKKLRTVYLGPCRFRRTR